MNETVFEALKEKLKNHGFNETINPALEAALQKEAMEFSLPYKTEINKHAMEATLHFKQSDKSEKVFFNTYDVRLQTEKDASVTQTFYINDGRGVTVKEAYNLLNGRAVFKELTNKEDQKYKAWIQLDFSAKDKNQNYERKLYHQNYGYDLKEALSYYPVKEMLKEETAKDLVRSLERGNVQMVTLDVAGKETKVFLEANPQYKSLNLYNGKMERLDKEARQEMMVKPEMEKVNGANKAADKDLKNSVTYDEKKSLLPKKEKGNGLLEKKKKEQREGDGTEINLFFMRYEDSVVELKKQLLSLGFADGLELALRSKICFQPDRFVLRYRLVKDADVVDFVLQFELAADTAYGCSFYEAVLRKRIPVERNDLDVAMQGINWKSVDDFSRIDAIVSGLKQLEVSDEGVLLSSLLKFKHWSGTAVEDLIPNLAAHRSKYEVNQRFYFFDGEGQITVEEAYRFLCNRWMEKQLQLRKKQEVPVVPAEAGSASPDNGLMKKVSLLPKKKRGQGSRMK